MPEVSEESIKLAIEYGRIDMWAKVTNVAGVIGGLASLGIAYRTLGDGYIPQDMPALITSGGGLVASIVCPVSLHMRQSQQLEELNATLPPTAQVKR